MDSVGDQSASERTLTGTRRDVVQLGLTLVAGGISAAALDRESRALAAFEADQDAYTTQDVQIDSEYDGTTITIAATVYEPTADGPHPAILGTHGWGGDRGNVDLGGFASNGYVGLAFDSRGFGESGGSSTIAGEAELADAQTLVTWLANRESVQTDGEGDPRLGMVGGSYGAGTQYMLAGADDRVDAIVPEYGWFDLTSALAPNDVLKNGWVLGLFLIGIAFDLDADVEARNEGIVQRGGLDADDRQYYQAHSTVSADDGTAAATLVVQEFNDRLFPGNEGIDNFHWADAGPGEAAFILGNGTAHAQLRENDLPGAAAYDSLVSQAVTDWFEDHLKDGEAHGLAPVNYYDAGAAAFVEAESFPPSAAVDHTFEQSIDEAIVFDGPDAAVVTLDWSVDHAMEIVGVPRLSVPVVPTGTGQQTLIAGLKRAADDHVMKRQVAPVSVEEETTVTFDLMAVQHRVEPGDTLQVVLGTRAQNMPGITFGLEADLFLSTEEGAGIELPAGGNVELTVPVRTETRPAPVAGNWPANPAGDGLYRSVRGDGEPGVFDVQTLFQNLDNPAIQEYAEYYNFQGQDAETVTVFDVQALFQGL